MRGRARVAETRAAGGVRGAAAVLRVIGSIVKRAVRCIIHRHHGGGGGGNISGNGCGATAVEDGGGTSAQWDQCIMPFGGIVEHCPPRSDKRIVCSSWSRRRREAGATATAQQLRQRRNGEEGRTSISIDCRVSPRAREAPSEYYSAVVESHHVVAARDLAERRQHRRGVERAGCCIDAAWRSAGSGRAGGGREGRWWSAIEGVLCVMAAPTFC
jgi:hypothetical protein